MRDYESALSSLSAEQHGAFARRQALRAGMSRSTFQRRVADGLFLPTGLPGVHRMAWAPNTWRLRLWAALLWAGEHATLSHDAAAVLFELDHFGPGQVHVTVPRGT